MALTAEDKARLEAYRSIGEMWRRRVELLFGFIEHCYERQTVKGIEDMVDYAFNATEHNPQYGSAGGLPAGKHPVQIVGTALKNTNDNRGGYLELTLEAIDGPAKGAKGIDRMNLNNTNADAVRIAQQQLAAICAVMGIAGFQNTEELHNKPFVVEVAPQKDKPQYTEVVAVFDMNGNKPGESGGNANNAPANNTPPTNNGGGNASANQGGGGWGAPSNNGGGDAPAGNQNQQGGGNGGGWAQGDGNNAGGGNAPGWG